MGPRVGITVAILSTFLCLVDSARHRRKDPVINIVNGSDAESCKWKWQVGMYKRGNTTLFCGGSLIAPGWVLTAKHCVGDRDEHYPLDLFAGDIKLAQGQKRQSRRIIRKADVDLALIELWEPFTLNDCVDVPRLPSEEVQPGTDCWITGWGKLARTKPMATTLQEADVEVVGYEACNSKMNNRVKTSDVCINGKVGDPTSACNGDSGGPLVCQTGGEFTLYGATSWGYMCNGITVYAGVHAAMDWIKASMEAPKTCPWYCWSCSLDACKGNCEKCDDKGP